MLVQTLFHKRYGPWGVGSNPRMEVEKAKLLAERGYCEIVAEDVPTPSTSAQVEPPQEPVKETISADDSQQQDGSSASEPEGRKKSSEARGRRT